MNRLSLDNPRNHCRHSRDAIMTTLRSLTRRLTCRIAVFVAEFEDIEEDWTDHYAVLESAVACSQVDYDSDPTICIQPQSMSVTDIRVVAGRFALRLFGGSLTSDRNSPAVVRLKSLLPAFDRGFVKQLTPARSLTGRARHIENIHATRDVLVGMCVDELWTHRIIKKVGLGVRLTDSIFSEFRREYGITHRWKQRCHPRQARAFGDQSHAASTFAMINQTPIPPTRSMSARSISHTDRNLSRRPFYS